MVNLILDTNQIVIKDWRLRSAEMRLVEKAVNLGLVSIVVPEIVVKETRNKFRQRLKTSISNMKSKKVELEKLLDTELELTIPNIDDECRNYGEYLDQRLNELNASRPSYTRVEHEWLVSKALGPRRPFQERDRGYRDALLWHAAVNEVASTNHQTFLVSANEKDFGDKKGGLHPHLVDDLNEAGVTDHVTYLNNLRTFAETVVKPALDRVPSPLTVGDFEELFDARLDSIIEKISSAIERKGLPDLPYELFEAGPYIEMLGLISTEPVDAYALDESTMYTEFAVQVEASFDQTVYFPDAIWISEEWNMSITGGGEKQLDLSFTLTIPLTIAVVTNTENDVEPEISVGLSEFYGFCKHCKEPVASDTAERCTHCGRTLF